MKDSRYAQGMQTTQYRGWSCEVEVELQDSMRAHSANPASESKRNDEQEYQKWMLEKILNRDNLNQAYKKVVKNKGSHGVDGMKVEELLEYLKQNGEQIKQRLLEGTYHPSPVRRIEIPKPDGGIRLLGIPTVLDRMIQQAIAQILTPIYEQIFSPNSYGFRPKKSAQQAIEKAQGYMKEGYRWVVDIDLEKFFDRVNHDKLMSMLSRKIKDKRVLKLIRSYLNSGVMINGLEVVSEEGCPQGSPLSPLLSNVMLDDLDKELERRNHKHCRFADDCNIYVKSKKAGERVMESITEYLNKVLKLKVNAEKSAVDRPWKRKFLGFSFYISKGEVKVRVHEKPIKKLMGKIKSATSRSNGKNVQQRIKELNQIVIGWVNYFGIADMKNKLQTIDEWTRRRMRMCQWKQWKKGKTRFKNLMKLGIEKPKAWEWANTRKGYWRISNSPILNRTLTNEHFREMGLVSLTGRYSIVH
ncbi:MAG: group II intron reverse transcriptase/maturase [Clostridiales bacterium]|nr:group II intron reverse transcriptase/maturase [Clostridiales bacterium]